MAAPNAIERLLQRERAITIAGLFVLWALTWVYLATGAGMGMAMDSSMPGMDMPGMQPQADAASWALMVAMWWTMMIAMMTPSAAPTVLLFARAHRHSHQQAPGSAAIAPVGAFVAGYFLAWLFFSLIATALQHALQQAGLLSAGSMSSQVRWLSAATLIASGIYQLSPMKNACLSHCRAPAQFLSRHWRPGSIGALRLGLLHGGYCVGCCWLLMALLLVGGVMNMAWIALLSLLVLAEKTLPGGLWLGRIAGVALVGWGVMMLVR